jgi:hypothetical protein
MEGVRIQRQFATGWTTIITWNYLAEWMALEMENGAVFVIWGS